MEKELVEFLIAAKKRTYAGHGEETAASRPNSHDLTYEEDGLKYIDTYLGGRFFSGEEAMWRNGVPFWAMNYSGRVLSGNFDIDFLKSALSNVPEENPYRGPECFKSGDYTYRCSVEGKPEWFQGYEQIQYRREKIYECYFHGGIVAT